MAITGGELWALGSAGKGDSPSTSNSQAWVQASVDLQGGEDVTVADAEGTPIASLTSEKDAQNVVYSSPSIAAGAAYAINGADVTSNTATQDGMGRGGKMGFEQGGAPSGGMPNGEPGASPAQRDTQAAVLPQDRRERA